MRQDQKVVWVFTKILAYWPKGNEQVCRYFCKWRICFSAHWRPLSVHEALLFLSDFFVENSKIQCG